MPLRGLPQLRRNLQAIARHAPTALGKAMFEEWEIEKTESMRRTPVEFGVLRASHHVFLRFLARVVEVVIGVGGPAAPYAIYVHEDPDAFHEVGQWKFLESTIAESARFMLRRIARRLSLRDLVQG